MTTCPNCLPADFPNARPGGPFTALSGDAMLAHIESEHAWMLRVGQICGACWRNVSERACTHYNAYGQPVRQPRTQERTESHPQVRGYRRS